MLVYYTLYILAYSTVVQRQKDNNMYFHFVWLGWMGQATTTTICVKIDLWKQMYSKVRIGNYLIRFKISFKIKIWIQHKHSWSCTSIRTCFNWVNIEKMNHFFLNLWKLHSKFFCEIRLHFCRLSRNAIMSQIKLCRNYYLNTYLFYSELWFKSLNNNLLQNHDQIIMTCYC